MNDLGGLCKNYDKIYVKMRIFDKNDGFASLAIDSSTKSVLSFRTTPISMLLYQSVHFLLQHQFASYLLSPELLNPLGKRLYLPQIFIHQILFIFLLRQQRQRPTLPRRNPGRNDG